MIVTIRQFTLSQLLLISLITVQSVALRLNISISSDNNFTITLSGEEWFRSGPVKVRNGGAWLSSSDGTLVLNYTHTSSAEDWLGKYYYHSFHYLDRSKEFRFITFIKEYFSGIDAVTFGQIFESGAQKTALDSADAVISSFPTIPLENSSLERGFLIFQGSSELGSYGMVVNVMSDGYVGQWNMGKITSGMAAGLPLTIFDKAMENTVVISPFREFMATSSHLDTDSDPHMLQLGVMGKADEVPKEYTVEFIMMAGDTVTNTLLQYGEVLRTHYGKDHGYRKADLSINYLGYWTDHGACYHYSTGNFSNYEEAILAAKEHTEKAGIPYQYLQIDSWWYYKGVDDGVKNWTAMPDIFPDGISGLSDKTGWPIVAHNRYWASNTDYAKQNGGDFDFIVGPGKVALPTAPQFWDYLFSVSLKQGWNLIVYEQDWLHTEVEKLPALESNVTLGRSWLIDMGSAAQKHGLTVQYCMPWTRHALQSVEIPSVTQIRVSGDYQPGNKQWIIGDSTIIAHALGLAAYKDTFQTVTIEKECQTTTNEIYPELEVTVAAFSGGPIGPGDRYDTFNKTLIMATCMDNGLLLKPTRPVMSLDSTFVLRTFGKGGPNGHLWAGYTMYDHSQMWYFIFAAEIRQEYTLTTKELPMFDSSIKNGIIYKSQIGSGMVTYISTFNAMNPLTVPVCGEKDFQTWTVAPIMNETSWVLLGETTKIVTMSEQRMGDIAYDGVGVIIVQLRGAPQEVVTVAAIDGSGEIKMENVKYFKCTVPDIGVVALEIPAGYC